MEITAPTIGNYVEQRSVSSVMPNKCSIAGPLESYINYINTQDWKNDLKSHEVSVSSYKDDGIETLKKSAPYTSLMEESELEYPPSNRKHCVKAETLTCLNFENSKVEEKSIDNLIEEKLTELETQTDVMLGQVKIGAFEDHEVGVEHESTNITKDLNVGPHIVNISNVLKVGSDDFPAGNAFSVFKEVLKIGPYDVDFLVNDTIMRNFDPGGVSCRENIFVCVTHKCETELGIEENSLASDFDASANKELKEREPSKHALDKDEEKCPLDISTLPVGESEQKAVENEFRVQGNYEFYTWSTSKLFGKFINGSWAESVFIVLKMDGGKILMNFDPCGKWRSQSNKDDNRRKLRFLTSYIESSQLVPEIESLNLRSKNFQWRYTLVDNRAILLLPTDSSFNPISSLEILSPTVGQCFKILWSDLPQRKLLAISCLGIWLKGFPYKTITREAHSLLLWYLPKVHVMTMLSLFVPRKILYALSTLGVISLQSYDDSFVLNVTIGDKKFDKEWDMGGSATKSILFDIYLAHELRSHLHDLCVYGMLMVRLTSEEMKMTEENKSSLVSTLVVWVGNQRCDNTWAGNTIFTWDQLHLSLSMVLQFRFQSQPLSMQERFSLKRLPTVLSSIVLGDLDELESEMTKIRGQAPLFLMSVDHHVPRQHALIRDFSEMQGSTLIEELQSHILKAIVVTCTIILSTYSMIGKSEHEYEEAHVYLTDAFCTIGEHDELLEGPWHFNCYITRGRVILWEGWNDTNNTNMERKLIMGEMSVVIIDAFGNVSWKNGQLRESLKLFHNVVNGLDPPVYEIDLSAVYPIYKTLIVADSTLYHLLDDAQTRGIKLEDEFVILGADGDDAVSLQDILKMRVIFVN